MILEPIFSMFYAVDELVIDNQKILEKCLEIRESDKLGVRTSNFGGWHSKYYDKVFQPFDELFFQIERNLNELKNDLGIRKDFVVKVKNYWVNINGKNDMNLPHNHVDYFLSGCYYVKVPNNSGKISLISPLINTAVSYHIEKTTPFSAGIISIPPKENTFVVFPSTLMHYVEPNNSDDERISIAFNTLLE